MLIASNWMRRLLLFPGITMLLLLANPVDLFSYESVEVNNGGVLYGKIRFKGAPPKNEIRQTELNQDYCGDSIEDETYLVSPENHGLQNVVVSISGITQGKKRAPSILRIQNLRCRFAPHVQAGMAGDSYDITNKDPILHNTHLKMDETSLINVVLPPIRKEIKKIIPQPGIIHLRCDVHTFMEGWVVIRDNPYFAVTDQNGNFKISDIPPGNYSITLWHEGLPVKTEDVTIYPNKKTELSVALGLR